MIRANAIILALALGVGVGCVQERAPASRVQEIIGGVETDEFPAIAELLAFDGLCTATLIAPRVMLTAAHCIFDAVEAGQTRSTVRFGAGPSASDFENVKTQRLLPHPRYDPDVIRESDIGLIWLREDPAGDPAPMAWHRGDLGQSDLGRAATAVGYGVSDGEEQTGGGRKRMVDLVINEVTAEHLGLGDGNKNICQGDSGGPVLLEVGGELTVHGVSSFGSNFCQNRSFMTRTDVYADFIDEVVAAWTGPCKFDLECNTEGCGDFVDPDCDICGVDGVCGAQCAAEGKVDLDCRVGRGQGAACSRPEQCGEGICDKENGICVERCGSDEDCAAPYACIQVTDSTSVCTVLGGTGGCSSTGGRSGSAPFAIGLLVFLWHVWQVRALGRRRHRHV